MSEDRISDICWLIDDILSCLSYGPKECRQDNKEYKLDPPSLHLHNFLSSTPIGDNSKVILNGWLSSSSCFLVTTEAEPKRAGPVPLVILYLGGEELKYPFGDEVAYYLQMQL